MTQIQGVAQLTYSHALLHAWLNKQTIIRLHNFILPLASIYYHTSYMQCITHVSLLLLSPITQTLLLPRR